MAVYHHAYGLRGEESEADFRFVEALAAAHQVPFFFKRVSAEERAARVGESIQEWARRLRYEELRRYTDEGWAIATAHHLDDLAETVLMRMARGTAPGTLAGMRVWRAPYWRPLLEVRRKTIAQYAAERGLTHREDSSNASEDYSRNVLRQKVLPELEALFPGAAERIVACALEAQALSEGEATPRHELAQFLKGAAPQAPLSRSFLDAANARLAQPNAANKAGPELPGQPAVRLSINKDGEWSLAKTFAGLKSERYAQHRRGLRAVTRSLILEPGSHAAFRQGGVEWHLDSLAATSPELSSNALPRTIPTHLRVFPAPKSLLEPLPAAERARWQALARDGEIVGLFDGHQLLQQSPR